MPLRLPSLGTRCRFLKICGVLTTKNKSVIKRLGGEREDQGWRISRSRVDNETVLVRLGLGGAYAEHFHIEMARAIYFGGKLPSTNTSIRELRRMVHEFSGEELKASAHALFRIRRQYVPELIKSSFFEKKQGKVGIKTTGGEFSFSGAPVNELRWSLTRNGKEVLVWLQASVAFKIDDALLENCFAQLTSALESFQKA